MNLRIGHPFFNLLKEIFQQVKFKEESNTMTWTKEWLRFHAKEDNESVRKKAF
jgi:hypothetical protein